MVIYRVVNQMNTNYESLIKILKITAFNESIWKGFV